MQIVIETNGSAKCLYGETIDLAAIGCLRIERASHVEPDANGNWLADIIDGPTLGPFQRRSDALKAEVDWLNTNRLSTHS